MSESNSDNRFMTERQVAEYLQLNEKNIYALATKEKIPATKVTGKWMFPRELVDSWMLESAHGGVFTDRLVIAGSEDSPALSDTPQTFKQHGVTLPGELHRNRYQTWIRIALRPKTQRQLFELGRGLRKSSEASCSASEL
jgi:excisionase family DNA binding protein